MDHERSSRFGGTEMLYIVTLYDKEHEERGVQIKYHGPDRREATLMAHQLTQAVYTKRVVSENPFVLDTKAYMAYRTERLVEIHEFEDS